MYLLCKGIFDIGWKSIAWQDCIATRNAKGSALCFNWQKLLLHTKLIYPTKRNCIKSRKMQWVNLSYFSNYALLYVVFEISGICLGYWCLIDRTWILNGFSFNWHLINLWSLFALLMHLSGQGVFAYFFCLYFMSNKSSTFGFLWSTLQVNKWI